MVFKKRKDPYKALKIGKHKPNPLKEMIDNMHRILDNSGMKRGNYIVTGPKIAKILNRLDNGTEIKEEISKTLDDIDNSSEIKNLNDVLQKTRESIQGTGNRKTQK